MSILDEDKGPKITISGKQMVAVPEITPQQALQNFEELARKHPDVDFMTRLLLLESVRLAASLVEPLPEVTLDGMLQNFDNLAKAHNCNHDLRMALIESDEVIKTLARAERDRLAKEAEDAKEAGPDGSSEAAGGEAASAAPETSG